MKLKVYIYAHHYSWNDPGDYRYSVQSYKSDGNESALIEEREIDFTPPSEKVVRVEIIASLRKMRAAILADAQEKAVKVDERIQSLLAIEHKPEGVE